MSWQRHLEVKHNPFGGECQDSIECPNGGMVWTIDNETRLADDPQRQWTEFEIDQGKPWHPANADA